MGRSSLQCLMVAVMVVTFASLLHYGEAQTGNQEENKNPNEALPGQLVRLLSVERTPAANGNRFTVRFSKDTYVDYNLKIHVQDNVAPPRAPDTVTHEPGGVWEATFDLPPRPDTRQWQWLIFTDQNISVMVAVMLDNDGSEPASQVFLEQPVVHIFPRVVAEYNSGEDVLVNVIVTKNSETGEFVRIINKSFMGLDLNSMRFYTDSHIMWLIPPRGIRSHDTMANFTMETSTRPVSGYVQLSVDVSATGGSLAPYIQVSRSIIVRPSNQAGVFPTGYLVFTGHSRETSPNGNELQTCSIGSECLHHCYAAGQEISEMDVKEVSPDGSLVDVPSAQEHSMATSTSNGMFWTFHAELDSGDSQGITTFQCKASDDVHGTQVTKLIDVLATIPATFDNEKTNVTVEEDPADQSKVRLIFRCAAKGRPIPKVLFEGYSIHYGGEEPDHVINTGPNEIVATRVDTIDRDYVVTYFTGFAVGPFCTIYDTVSHSYKEHFFSLPGGGEN